MQGTDKTYYFDPNASVKTAERTAARITVFDGANSPYHVDLTSFGKAIITFGREAGNDIVLKSGYVSRHHGQFRFMNGYCFVDDLGSKNGLAINGSILNSKALNDGDSIRIDDRNASTQIGVLIMFSTQSYSSERWKQLNLGAKQSYTIGRDPSCDVCLNHVTVSKIHAGIVLQNGHYFLFDNGSTNGVFVNGRKISSKVLLKEKDLITITNSKLIYNAGTLNYCTYNRGIRVGASHIVKTVDNGRKTICNDVSLEIEPCELVAIIGGSGAGKSTIMNCISGYNAPTSGFVNVNGVDLYQNFESIKNIIGYVPQQDIVFENLTVYSMLKYTADLRLPKDMSPEEKKEVILRVIDTVELTERKDTLIKKLSGGQKKRASIAVELISDPNLFFLDEPASGLDPGTERNLMRTLRSMTMKGKTVIFVTHSTLNLHMCDKIVFMGAGGRLCFCGNYTEALKFFGVDDLVDVYNMITENSPYWQQKYLNERGRANIAPAVGSGNQRAVKERTVHQVAVLARRHLHVLFNDRVRLLLILLQAPLLALLISFVADGNQFEQYEMTKSLLFSLSCSAFWIGILNSIQEICKERVILRREYMTGLSLRAYITSKVLVMGLICIVQSALLAGVFCAAVGLPDEGVVMEAFLELWLVTFFTAFSASATGIFVSAMFKNADRAMTVAPILLMPQLLFSGLIFKLEGATKVISWIAACRFSMEGYGTTANLNSLDLKLQQQGMPLQHVAEDFFDYTGAHFWFAVLMLAAFVVVFSLLAALILRNIKKNH